MSVLAVLSNFFSKNKKQSFLIGYSGGLDSTVLLHAFSTLQKDFPKIKLRAIHINHQLQKKANAWEKHCQKMCKNFNVPLTVARVKVAKKTGESLEALARDARYAAIAKTIKANEQLLTAHHMNDQAETILLQLFRGAGLKGLSGMPALREKIIGRKKIFQARPMLSLSREALQEYAEKNNLKWIEDPSNANIDFDRNFLRHKVLPLLETRFLNAKECMVRSGTHAAEAQHLLDELAKQDYLQVKTALPTPFGKENLIENVLDGKILRTLSEPRQKNVLRYWLSTLQFSMPSEKKLDQILKTVLQSAWDRSPCVEWGNVEVRRYRQWLFAMKPFSFSLKTKKKLTKKQYQTLGVPPWWRN